MAKKSDSDQIIKIKESERLLLHAILEKDDALAMQFYEEWTKAVPLDQVEGGSFRLVPMLYKRLSELRADFIDKDRIAGIYKYSLYRNHMLFRHCLPALEEIKERGIDMIVLKGAALTAAYYKDYGIRPMTDIDILVEEKKISIVVDILKNLGWTLEEETSINKLIKAFHAVHMIHGDGYTMDVHWAISDYWFRQAKGPKNRFATETASLSGCEIKILAPVYQLLHNAVHGVMWNEMSSVRWIADTVVILKNRESDIDWELFIREAEKEKLSYALENILKFLIDEFNVNIPETVIRQLESAAKDKNEIEFFRCVSKRPGFLNMKSKWLAYSQANRNELENKIWIIKCFLFAEYLKEIWKLDRIGDIPGYMIKRGFNKIRAKKTMSQTSYEV